MKLSPDLPRTIHKHASTSTERKSLKKKLSSRSPSPKLVHTPPTSDLKTHPKPPHPKPTMKTSTNLLALSLSLLLNLTTATLDPATSNTKGAYPASPGCSASKTSTSIQAAECSHNTRTSETQTFAIFKTDHQYDDVEGAPYGTCEAYTCAAPSGADLTSDENYWTFFWGDKGESSGEGAGCIKDPQSGECGCENSDGTFIAGSSSCS